MSGLADFGATGVQAQPVNGASNATSTKEFQNKGFQIRAQRNVNDAVKAKEGSKRDSIAFVKALSTHKRTQAVDAQTEEQKQKMNEWKALGLNGVPQPFGYRFRNVGKEPIKVPQIPFQPPKQKKSENGLRTSMVPPTPYDVIKEKASAIVVAPGQQFDLNIVETCVLISQLEYAGAFTGALDGVKREVYISANTSGEDKQPKPVLKGKGFSVKEDFILIDEKDGNRFRVLDDYKEKFGLLYPVKKATDASGKPVQETIMNTAAAFADMYGIDVASL